MSKSVTIRRELAYSKPAYQVHKMTMPAVIYISGTLFGVTHWPPSLSHDLSTVRAEHCSGPHPSTGCAGVTTWPLFSPARSARELFGGGGGGGGPQWKAVPANQHTTSKQHPMAVRNRPILVHIAQHVSRYKNGLGYTWHCADQYRRI